MVKPFLKYQTVLQVVLKKSNKDYYTVITKTHWNSRNRQINDQIIYNSWVTESGRALKLTIASCSMWNFLVGYSRGKSNPRGNEMSSSENPLTCPISQMFAPKIDGKTVCQYKAMPVIHASICPESIPRRWHMTQHVWDFLNHNAYMEWYEWL